MRLGWWYRAVNANEDCNTAPKRKHEPKGHAEYFWNLFAKQQKNILIRVRIVVSLCDQTHRNHIIVIYVQYRHYQRRCRSSTKQNQQRTQIWGRNNRSWSNRVRRRDTICRYRKLGRRQYIGRRYRVVNGLRSVWHSSEFCDRDWIRNAICGGVINSVIPQDLFSVSFTQLKYFGKQIWETIMIVKWGEYENNKYLGKFVSRRTSAGSDDALAVVGLWRGSDVYTAEGTEIEPNLKPVGLSILTLSALSIEVTVDVAGIDWAENRIPCSTPEPLPVVPMEMLWLRDVVLDIMALNNK